MVKKPVQTECRRNCLDSHAVHRSEKPATNRQCHNMSVVGHICLRVVSTGCVRVRHPGTSKRVYWPATYAEIKVRTLARRGFSFRRHVRILRPPWPCRTSVFTFTHFYTSHHLMFSHTEAPPPPPWDCAISLQVRQLLQHIRNACNLNKILQVHVCYMKFSEDVKIEIKI